MPANPNRMRTRALILTWILSILPLALGWLSDGDLVLRGSLHSAPVLLPWIVLAGLPRSSDAPSLRTSALAALMAPPVALATGLDLSEGKPVAELAPLLGTAGVVVLLLSHAANGAVRRGGAVARSYALAWFLFVPLSATILFVRVQAALPTVSAGDSTALPGERWTDTLPDWVLGTSPAALVHALGRREVPGATAWLVLGSLVLTLCALGRRGSRAPESGA